jgi:hypothetical protein
VSSISSESQVGFFSQASKFLSSALGTSKKGKPEVKKIMQMAAVAAKKVRCWSFNRTFYRWANNPVATRRRREESSSLEGDGKPTSTRNATQGRGGEGAPARTRAQS